MILPHEILAKHGPDLDPETQKHLINALEHQLADIKLELAMAQSDSKCLKMQLEASNSDVERLEKENAELRKALFLSIHKNDKKASLEAELKELELDGFEDEKNGFEDGDNNDGDLIEGGNKLGKSPSCASAIAFLDGNVNGNFASLMRNSSLGSLLDDDDDIMYPPPSKNKKLDSCASGLELLSGLKKSSSKNNAVSMGSLILSDSLMRIAEAEAEHRNSCPRPRSTSNYQGNEEWNLAPPKMQGDMLFKNFM